MVSPDLGSVVDAADLFTSSYISPQAILGVRATRGHNRQSDVEETCSCGTLLDSQTTGPTESSNSAEEGCRGLERLRQGEHKHHRPSAARRIEVYADVLIDII